MKSIEKIIDLAKISRYDACQLKIQDYSPLDLKLNHLPNAESEITSILTKLSYNENIDILTIASYLLYKSAVGHKYSNGNKRTALFLLINFLELCGLYLCGKEYKYTEKYEKIIVHVVVENEKINFTKYRDL